MKKRSAETELRDIKSQLRAAQAELTALRQEVAIARGQRTKAQQDAAEWRARFDALLARVPVSAMPEPKA